jgi:hypothetical protein
MVHSGSPSLHTALEDCSNVDGAASGAGGELHIPRPSRVQRGNPDHPDGHGADHCNTARYAAPPRPAAGLLGGGASVDLSSTD